jgi:hypothetical protein
MATRRPRYHRAPRAPVRPPLSYSISNWIMTFASIAMVVIVGYLAWPVLLHNFQAGTSSAPPLATPAPTLAPMQRQQLQQAAPQTAVEQQAIQQAVPTADTRQPPPLPVQATAASRAASRHERRSAAVFAGRSWMGAAADPDHDALTGAVRRQPGQRGAELSQQCRARG